MNDKTRADDALISTDIDAIIRHLASKKRAEINALARELGMKTDILKKWIGILEDEGYVKVEYRLLSAYVVWAGAEMPGVEKEKEIVEETPGHKEEFFTQPEIGPKREEKKAEKKAETRKEERARGEIGAEERVERILERIGKEEEEEKASEGKIIWKEPEEAGEERTYEIAKEEMEEAKKEQIAFAPKEERRMGVARAEAEKAGEEIVSLKKSISEYLEEIKEQKGEIGCLKAAKAKLLEDVYMPAEQRFAATFEDISERLLEKESKIIELKERLAGLPEKVGEAGKLEAALKKIRQESAFVLSENREGMKKLRETLREEDARLREQLEAVEKSAKAKKAEIGGVRDALSALGTREEELKKTIEVLNKNMMEINEAVASSYASIAQFSRSRAELADKLEEMKNALDARSNEAVQTYARLESIGKLESAVGEYLSDYQQKMGEIEDYAKRGESELAQLRECAEVKYIRNYVKELGSLSSEYERELESAAAQEQSIDERISEAKGKLNDLLGESRALVKSLEKKTSGKDFEKLFSEMRGKQEAMLATVKEKSAEREKIRGQAAYLPKAREKTEKKPERKAKKTGKKKRK